MFCLYFLSTHKSDRPKNHTIIRRHRDVYVGVFTFIRGVIFDKWEVCEIDAQELFWASIVHSQQ